MSNLIFVMSHLLCAYLILFSLICDHFKLQIRSNMTTKCLKSAKNEGQTLPWNLSFWMWYFILLRCENVSGKAKKNRTHPEIERQDRMKDEEEWNY